MGIKKSKRATDMLFDPGEMEEEERCWKLFCDTALMENWDSALDGFPKEMTKFLFKTCLDRARAFYIDTVIDTWKRRIEERFSKPRDRKCLLSNLINSMQWEDHFNGRSRRDQKRWMRWGADSGLHDRDQKYFDECCKEIVRDLDEFIDLLMKYGESVHEAWCNYLQDQARRREAARVKQHRHEIRAVDRK